MSQLEVDKIIPQSGTTLTIGDSGDTVNFADGTNLSIDTNTLFIDSTNNRVGIANSSPSVALDVTGAAKMSGDLTVDTNTLFVDASENTVVVGGTDASSWNANADELVVAGASAGGMTFYNPTQTNIFFADGTSGDDLTRGRIQYVHSDNSLRFGTNSTERARIDTSGRLLVGKTATNIGTAGIELTHDNVILGTRSGGVAQYLNRLSSDGSVLEIMKDGTSVGVIGTQNWGIGTSSPSSELEVYGASTPKITVKSGNGTSASIKLQRVNENDASTDFELKNDGGELKIIADNSSQNEFETLRLSSTEHKYFTNNSERMRINSSGNLLVGKTASNIATAGIEVDGNFNKIQITRDGGTPFFLNRLTSDGDIVDFRKDGTTLGAIGSRGGAAFYIEGTQTNFSGIEFVGPNPAIYPKKSGSLNNGDVNLGGANYRYKDLYLAGSVFLGGTGSANALDDYEEGTWTPFITTTGGAPSVTYAERTGKYTKIGNVVYYEFYIETSAFSGGSGNLVFGQLPFTVQAGRGAIGLASGSRVALGIESAVIIPDQNADSFAIRIKNSTGTGSGDNLTTLPVGAWSNLNPTILYGAGYYRTDS